MTRSTAIFAASVVSGLALGVWAGESLPPGTPMGAVPIRKRTTRGPYRWLKHPMYLGNTLQVAGFAGLAAGWWNAIALGMLTETIMREWAGREERRTP